MIDHDHDHTDDHDRGLQFDLTTALHRRRMLGLLAGAGLAAVAGCAADPPATGPPPTTTAPAPAPSGGGGTGAAADAGTEIPPETAGPFPGDGSNGPNALTTSGIVRGDIRSSFGTASGVAAGVPLTLTLSILDVARGGDPYVGAAVYLWHCDRNGSYSMYSPDVADENYLRGVQAADADGKVTFTTIFPGAYQGRWPHAHFEVYPTLAGTASAANVITTSQLALPEAVCRQAYAADGYDGSLANLGRTSLTSDTVFRDGAGRQLVTVTGDARSGYVATLTVPVLA
jgi:protocatechuate 3,4-dioxygenase beta subunit